jgi:hypothetical protein
MGFSTKQSRSAAVGLPRAQPIAQAQTEYVVRGATAQAASLAQRIKQRAQSSNN